MCIRDRKNIFILSIGCLPNNERIFLWMSHNFSEKIELLGRIPGNFESCSYFVTIVEKSNFLLVKIVFTQKRRGNPVN